MSTIALKVNGRTHTLDVDATTPLLDLVSPARVSYNRPF